MMFPMKFRPNIVVSQILYEFQRNDFSDKTYLMNHHINEMVFDQCHGSPNSSLCFLQ